MGKPWNVCSICYLIYCIETVHLHKIDTNNVRNASVLKVFLFEHDWRELKKFCLLNQVVKIPDIDMIICMCDRKLIFVVYYVK